MNFHVCISHVFKQNVLKLFLNHERHRALDTPRLRNSERPLCRLRVTVSTVGIDIEPKRYHVIGLLNPR